MARTRIRVSGRGWAYTGAIVGGLISLAANLAHSYVAPHGAPQDWSPERGAVIESTVWPILLFLGVEILVTVKWPKGPWWVLARFGGLLPIVLTAGVVSYRHMRGLLLFYGEEPLIATIGPLAVDGLMVMATAAIYAAAIQRNNAMATSPAPTAPAHAVSPPAPTVRHQPVVTTQVTIPEKVMETARFAVSTHRHRTGQDMTADQLAMVMNVSPEVAREILANLPSTDLLPVLNGQVSG